MLRRAFDWVFRSRKDGRIVVAQLPNVALGTFMVATVVDRLTTPEGRIGCVVHAVGTTALLWWAGDELLRGVNPFRRTLGAVLLALTLRRLLA